MFAKYQINPQKIAKEFLNIAEVAKFQQISAHTDSDLLKVWASLRRQFSFCHYLADNLVFKVVILIVGVVGLILSTSLRRGLSTFFIYFLNKH